MGRKTTVKEFYFYKKEDNSYSVDIVSGRNEHIRKAMTVSSRSDVDEILEAITNNKHSKYSESKRGMKIYNKLPDDIVLSHNPSSIVNVYLDNLKEIKESSQSRHLAANLLRAAADLLSHDDEERTVPDIGIQEPQVGNVEVDPDSIQMATPSLLGVSPEPAVTTEVPFGIIDFIQESLDVTIEINNLTFWFNDQKWQLQKDIDDHVSPTPKRPKASPVIMNAMDFMSNLLGVNGEKSVDPDHLYFRFNLFGDMYKISHVYTGDKITKGL